MVILPQQYLTFGLFYKLLSDAMPLTALKIKNLFTKIVSIVHSQKYISGNISKPGV